MNLNLLEVLQKELPSLFGLDKPRFVILEAGPIWQLWKLGLKVRNITNN